MITNPICDNCVFRFSSYSYAPLTTQPFKTSSYGFTYSTKTYTDTEKILFVFDVADSSGHQHAAISGEGGNGFLLRGYLKEIDYDKKLVYATSVLHCHTTKIPNYKIPSVDYCFTQHLLKEILTIRPTVIVPMGTLATSVLTGMAGKKRSLDDLRGYILPLADSIIGKGSTVADALYLDSVKVIPTYSPLMVKGDYSLYEWVMKRDINFAFSCLRDNSIGIERTNYKVGSADSLLEMIDWMKKNPDKPVGFDIETEEAQELDGDDLLKLKKIPVMQSIQLSIAEGTGEFYYWTPTIKELFIKLLNETKNTLVGHFIWNFDLKVLYEQEGIEIDVARTDDTLAMFWHCYPELTKSLGFVGSLYGMTTAWKHTITTDLANYGCKDVDAVMRIYPRLKTEMEEVKAENGLSLWDGYNLFAKGIRPILWKAERRGIPRDSERVQELGDYIQKEQKDVYDKIFEAVPASIKPIKINKSWPRDLTPLVKAKAQSRVEGKVNSRGNPVKPAPFKISDPEAPQFLLEHNLPFEIENPGTAEAVLISRGNFKPLATAHLKKYLIANYINVPVGLNAKTTTGKMEMDKLLGKLRNVITHEKYGDLTPAEKAVFAKGIRSTRSISVEGISFEEAQQIAKDVNSFITDVFAYRKYNKAYSTYVKGKGWEIGKDGRIHTTFTLSTTPTGQLSSVRPNVQNITKGKDAFDLIGIKLGKALRKTIKAEPDHAIVEADFSACHIATMAELAQDKTYERIGKMDAHSFLTSHIVENLLIHNREDTLSSFLPSEQTYEQFTEELKVFLKDLKSWPDLPDKELKANLTKVKKMFKGIRDAQAKVIVLGMQLGLGSRKLFFQNDKAFTSPKEAEHLQSIMKNLFPSIGRFQSYIKEVAHKQGQLISRHGFRRMFADVMRMTDRGLVSSSNAEKALAFFVQNSAFGIIRESMLTMEELGYMDLYEFINTVHDSLVFHPHLSLLKDCILDLTRVMEMPSKYITSPAYPDGLTLKVEVSAGEDWGSIDEIVIVDGKPIWNDWIKREFDRLKIEH